MLIQVLFAIVMLFGIAALYADLGMARLAQIQMQNSADAAALEGMRYRDGLKQVCDGLGLSAADCTTLGLETAECATLGLTTEQCDAHKQLNPRWNAAQAASGFGAADLWQGAGPQISIAGRDIDYETTANTPSFRPTPQFNAGNACEGDMVTGFYDPGFSHAEDNSYVRSDFSRQSGAADDCTTTLVPETPSAMLVRLRRTGEVLADPDSGSIGPTLPLLFGQASTLQTIGASTPKVDGIPVRATAIATARPALRVGSPVPPSAQFPNGIPGLVNVTLTIDFWLSLTSGIPACLVTDSLNVGGLQYGMLPSALLVDPAHTVGTQIVVPPMLPVIEIDHPEIIRYAPIFDTATSRVVGFGAVNITTPSCPGGAFDVVAQKPFVAFANASAVPGTLAIPVSAPAGALLAPVLAH